MNIIPSVFRMTTEERSAHALTSAHKSTTPYVDQMDWITAMNVSSRPQPVGKAESWA